MLSMSRSGSSALLFSISFSAGRCHGIGCDFTFDTGGRLRVQPQVTAIIQTCIISLAR